MKNFIKRVLCLIMVGLMAFGLFACYEREAPSSTTYTIQYTDDDGTHQLVVEGGMPYSIDPIPQKTGYDFVGLFNEERGGLQYVSATGSSLEVFKDGQNVILFPRFKAKEYIFILDYQGAAVVGEREIKATYDGKLPSLPQNLTLEHKDFLGWFTEENCGGVQVADDYGLLPATSVVNASNFDISNPDGYIYLYAGFKVKTFTVRFEFGEGIPVEEMEIPYGTPIVKVFPETRNADGFAVLSWSASADGNQPFTGNITEETTLYANEWAPCIDFDCTGGKEISPIVARANTAVSLPTPTKDLAQFLYWADGTDEQVNITKMPAESTTVKAVWQGVLAFDENGGSEVADISVAPNEEIALPTPTKEGYMFAGWFTADKSLYSATKMPAEGVQLKAGWYVEKTDKVVVISSTDEKSSRIIEASPTTMCYPVEHEKYAPNGQTISVRIEGHAKVKTTYAERYGAIPAYMEIYSQRTISTSNLLARYTCHNVIEDYKGYDFNINITMKADVYLCWYHGCPYDSWPFYVSDFYYTIHYPDTSHLYL